MMAMQVVVVSLRGMEAMRDVQSDVGIWDTRRR